MDLSSPIASVIPSSHGPVLAVLARTERPLTGRKIAELTGGRVSQPRVSQVLRQLVESGIVLFESHPPANLYRLSRQHLAADAIIALAELRDQLLKRMREHLSTWTPRAHAAWAFGSFARGEGDPSSDIDVLILRSDSGAAEDPIWTAQVDSFLQKVHGWSGNQCSVVEYSASEFEALMDSGETLPADIQRDGIHLAGRPLPRPAKMRAGS